jgi:hypothetical protein
MLMRCLSVRQMIIVAHVMAPVQGLMVASTSVNLRIAMPSLHHLGQIPAP